MKLNEKAGYGVCFLIIALIAAIIHLPSFKLLDATSIYLRIIWRYMIFLILLIPKLIYDIIQNAQNFSSIVAPCLGPVFFLSLLNTAFVFLVYFAVEHTFVAHTLLLCSIGTTYVATWKIANQDAYTRLDYLGIGFNVFGAYLCCCEGAPLDSIISIIICIGSDILIGNFSAIASSAVFAIYSIHSKNLIKRTNLPISFFFSLLSIYVIIVSYAMGKAVGEDLQFSSFDPTNGMFGMLSSG